MLKAECYELCLLYHFAGLYQVSGTFGRSRQGCPARVGRGRLAALLVLAAATEFLFVAVAAYFAAILYHRLILLDWPDPAKYLPESLLISTASRYSAHGQYGSHYCSPPLRRAWSTLGASFL